MNTPLREPASLNLWPVFAVSTGLLSFEICLLRILLYSTWHHFAFLVISAALLGFGVGGILLSFLRTRLLKAGPAVLGWLVLATGLSMPAGLQLARGLPLEARFLPALLGDQLLAWTAHWTLLGLPFLLGGAAVGLALMRAGRRLPRVYAVNLAGSALGALLALPLMRILPPAWLAAASGALCLAGLPFSGLLHRRVSQADGVLHGARPRVRQGGRSTESRGLDLRPSRLAPATLAAAACVLGCTAWLLLDPPRLVTDSYKYRARVAQLEEQGLATPAASATGPRGVLEVFEGPAFHELAFLDPGTRPPPLLALLVDGHWSASIIDADEPDEAVAADRTLMSLPYAFLPAGSRVLLLEEYGGGNVWLALRHGARLVQVVQPLEDLPRLMEGPLLARGGTVFQRAGVVSAVEDPRQFVDRAGADFDLLQLSSLESWGASSAGLGGVRENHLVTVEGLAACLGRLAPEGILLACRGLQQPPRDILKLAATLFESLRDRGATEPARHIAVVRDFLGACLMVRNRPWRPDEIDQLRITCGERRLTPVWYPGIRPDELNHPDRLPGPEGLGGDWLYHGLERLGSAEAGRFIDDWPFDIRPPTDDRPFFADFGRLSSLGALRQSYGELWLVYAEPALLFVLAAALVIALAGALLSLLPAVLAGGMRGCPGRWITAAWFAAIGLAYLMLEICLLSYLTRLVGDPLTAGALTIGGLLCFSGLGSLSAGRLRAAESLLPVLLAALVLLVLILPPVLQWLKPCAAELPDWGRRLCALGLIAVPGYLMGFPMPLGLRRLNRGRPALLPWAWGLNGFASVLAPPLATALGMSTGYLWAGGAALLLYLLAAGGFRLLPGSRENDRA